MILVDSDVLIAHLRGLPGARGWMLETRRRTGPIGVSVISLAEIVGGMRSNERSEVARLLSSLRVIPADERVGRAAGELKRRFRRSHHNISLADYVIAATARVHSLELATLNTKHFPMFDGLRPPFRS